MRLHYLPLIAAATLGLGACGSTTSSDDDRPTVIASFYPASVIAERVGGDLIDLDTLTSPGGEAHDLELTGRQIAALGEADLVVFLSEFQAAVDEAIEQSDLADGQLVDLADEVSLLDSRTSESHDSHAEEEHAHAEEEHAHDEEHPEEEHAHDDGHHHGDTDPHLWLDPTNLKPAVTHVVAALSEIDSANATTYEQNGDALLADLSTLDEEFATGLAHCETRDFVTSHAAFGYLASAYDLNQIAIAGVDPQSEPSSAQLAQITDVVNESGITTVFTERLASAALAETVARETGAQTATLDPIEGLTEETADEDYFSLMRANLAALQKANTCS